MVRRAGGLSVLLLALSFAAPFLAAPARGGWPLPLSTDASADRPYVVRTDGSRATATPIDPATLADAGGPVEFRLPQIDYGYRWWCRSSDGANLAVYDGQAMVVRDAATRAERHRFPVEWDLYRCSLSRDGGRLVVVTLHDRQMSGTSVHVPTYDLETGAAISDFVGTHAGDLEYWTDPDARSLYQLRWEYPGPPGDGGPKHPRLIAYDLDTGRERASLPLPGVVAGGWWESPADGDGPYPVVYSPAGALLPDGKRFVVVHVDLAALTIVDTETMTVERTVALERSAGIGGRLLALLGLAPRPAAAAAMEGATLHVALHPDGRHVYVTGNAWWPEGEGDYGSRGLGLLLIDVERGQIEADLPDVGFDQVMPSPDGRSLYAVGPRPGEAGGVGGAPSLRRLDVATLETLETRDLVPGSGVALIPDDALAAIGATPAGG